MNVHSVVLNCHKFLMTMLVMTMLMTMLMRLLTMALLMTMLMVTMLMTMLMMAMLMTIPMMTMLTMAMLMTSLWRCTPSCQEPSTFHTALAVNAYCNRWASNGRW